MASAGLSEAVTGVLGSSVVERVARQATAGKLRILAYHGIPDPMAFAAQLDHLQDLYHPISGEEVTSVLSGKHRFPKDAVWVTFDDGRPEVVTDGLPLLVARGIPATMYVCPSVIDTADPFWWDVVAQAQNAGVHANESELKRIPDADRRATVAKLSDELNDRGIDVTTRQITPDELSSWEQGMEVGNHTWDHPLLDQCTDEEQVRQIEQAHNTIAAIVGAPTSFAYPNGNVTATARERIRRLGYTTGVDFAHRLCKRDADPFVLPRLRVDTDAPLPRFRAIASGAHSGVFGLRRNARHDDGNGMS